MCKINELLCRLVVIPIMTWGFHEKFAICFLIVLQFSCLFFLKFLETFDGWVSDAGKSTIGGQILFLSGQVDDRTIQKYEKEAKDKARDSW